MVKNLEKRLDFQKYNIKEKKQKEKEKKKKPQELLKNKQTNKRKKKHTNNHPKSIYGVCLKKKPVIIGYRNKN